MANATKINIGLLRGNI